MSVLGFSETLDLVHWWKPKADVDLDFDYETKAFQEASLCCSLFIATHLLPALLQPPIRPSLVSQVSLLCDLQDQVLSSVQEHLDTSKTNSRFLRSSNWRTSGSVSLLAKAYSDRHHQISGCYLLVYHVIELVISSLTCLLWKYINFLNCFVVI